MSIIYLAGEDRAPEEDERFPPHKSRFWAYPGADAHVFGWITQSVGHRWSFTWLRLSQARQDVA
jgi:hypothetical protein